MNYLICKSGFASVISIASRMQSDVQIYRKRNETWYKWNGERFIRAVLPTFNSNDVIFKWGNSITLNLNGAKVINQSSASSLASNKKECRLFLRDNDISVPLTHSYDEISHMNFSNIPVPFIARPPKHHGGSDFYIINNMSEMVELLRTHNINDWYFQSVINKTNEYRVHVAYGKVLGINEKPLIPGEIRANQAITEASWGTCVQWNAYNKQMCLLACNAVNRVGLDTGAVDIMFDGINYYVAEINTSPYIADSEYLSGRYAKFFDWIINNPESEWYEYTQWNQGKSFAWKNNQLDNTNENV